MIWPFILAAVIAVGAWFTFPQFRAFVDGAKTHIAASAIIVGQLVEAIDKQLLSQALGLDGQGKAILFLVLGLAVVWFRAIAKKPGALVRDK